jgi:hypothetical protein
MKLFRHNFSKIFNENKWKIINIQKCDQTLMFSDNSYIVILSYSAIKISYMLIQTYYEWEISSFYLNYSLVFEN